MSHPGLSGVLIEAFHEYLKVGLKLTAKQLFMVTAYSKTAQQPP